MINTVLVIIGTFVGAGFASGREILTFFINYGNFGLIGLFVSGFIIGFVIYKTFNIIITNNINSYSDFIGRIFNKSSFLKNVIYNIINIFLLISFIVMVSGFSAYFSQEFGVSSIFGAVFICILSFFTFLKNIDGIIKVNKYLIPLLILMILFLGFKLLNCTNIYTKLDIPNNNYWFVSSLLYASYNLITLFPILISLKKYVFSLKQAKMISILATFFLVLMSLILFLLIKLYYTEIQDLELPTVYISSKISIFYRYFYGFAILSAIFTTATSSGYSLLNNLNIKSKQLYMFISLLLCAFAITLSNIGFTTLLNLLYPILGFFGFIQIIFILFFSKTT